MSLLGYVLRRCALAVGLLFALVTITFWIDQAIPYDPGMYLLQGIQQPSDEQLAEANRLLGVDKPATAQYVDFLKRLAVGDLGISWETVERDREQGIVAEEVGPMVLRAAGVTGSLVLGGGLLLLLIAIPGGVWLAARAGSLADHAALLVALAALSTHPLVLGNLLQLFFGERLGWVPSESYCPLLTRTEEEISFTGLMESCGGPVDWASHLILPWITFAALLVALHLRQMRSSAMGILAQPYVQAARSKGVPERGVMRGHVMPNALPPVVAGLAADVGAILGVALYVEVTFGLEGLGYVFLRAVEGSVGFDRPVIIGVILVVGITVVLANLIADLTIAALDPRVRLQEHGDLLGSAE